MGVWKLLEKLVTEAPEIPKRKEADWVIKQRLAKRAAALAGPQGGDETNRGTRMYRCDTSKPLKSLEQIIKVCNDPRSKQPARIISGEKLNPNGGVITLEYGFDPSNWGRWDKSLSKVLPFAATDSSKDFGQHAGKSQGVHALKANYGGGVSFAAGKAKSDYERRSSAMDTYDILMVGDIKGTPPHPDQRNLDLHQTRDRMTGKSATAISDDSSGICYKIVYSPSIGTSEERTANLKALLDGGQTQLSRRPQPQRPVKTRAEEEEELKRRKKAQGDDGSEQSRVADSGRSGSGNNADFINYLKKKNDEFVPSASKSRQDRDEIERLKNPEDDEDRLFSPKDTPRSNR